MVILLLSDFQVSNFVTNWSCPIEYKFYWNKNYDDGAAQCVADGPYRMPVINNQDENDQIKAIMAAHTPNSVNTIWLGINDEQNEGTWVDQDGQPISFKNFRFENSNDASKNHARLLHSINDWDGEWKYTDGSQPGTVLCIRII